MNHEPGGMQPGDGMNGTVPRLGRARQPALRWLAVIVLSASFLCAVWVNFGVRMRIEAGDKTVGLLVDYDELKRLADGSRDISFADAARKAGLAGATGLVVRERLLADWENAGEILTFTGGQLAFHSQSSGEGSLAMPSPDWFIADTTYILVKDPQVYEQIFSLLEVKRRYPEAFDYPGYKGIAARLNSAERAALGLGFPLKQMGEAAEAGFQIIPRLRNWEPVREDSLAAVMGWVAKIPNLAGIGFNDMSVPGGGITPAIQDMLAEAVRPLGKPLISFEFYDQSGLAGLASRLDNRVLRAHAIAENELRKYANIQDAMDRYSLAATERNIRYIYLRFYNMENPSASMAGNMDLIGMVRDGLAAEGLQVGNPAVIPSFHIPYALHLMLGFGVIAAGGWLAALGAAPFAPKKLYLPFALLLAAGGLAWAGLLAVAPVLARKLFALAGAVVFPSLGVVLVVNQDLRQAPSRSGLAGAGFDFRFRFRTLFHAVKLLLAMSAFTLAGAMIMSALLAEPAFMLKLNGFTGVKAAHILPLALIPFLLWLREGDRYGLLSGAVKGNVRFWQLAAGLVMLAGLAIYILRTGNDSLGAVSGIEMHIRQLLDRILVVRPRTKEFLIGHPLMLALLYFGYRFPMFPVLAAGAVGQISLINTYAHIHTPLAPSLARSAHGLWIGILLGGFAIAAFTWACRRVQAFGARYGKGGEGDAVS